jgi:CspA family cold shock protein
MAQGKIKWFDPEKGYGFITPIEGSEDSKDVFVHISKFQQSDIANLQEGQSVSYEVEDNRGRKAATNITFEN